MKTLRIGLFGLAITSILLISGVFSAQDLRVEIINVRYHTHPNFTRIVLDIGRLREYIHGELHDPDRVYIDVLQAKLNPILHGQSYHVQTDYLSQIRIAQKSPSTVRVTADLDFSEVQSYRVYHLYDPFRLVLDIYPRRRGDIVPENPRTKDTPPAKPPDPSRSGYSMARQLGLGVGSIVIDPGHGGNQPGCIARSGLMEKTLTLDIALALKNELAEKTDLDIVLTRETDIAVPLEYRTVIANQKRADLFISIHVNAHRDRKREGVETFFLNFNPDPAVNEIAARENATSTKNIGQLSEIIQKIVENSKIQESRTLAEKIQKNLVQSLSLDHPKVKNLGVKGGPFLVLIGGRMPSVLVEVSHLSNPREEEKLKTMEYRNLIVQGIANGIIEYIQSLGKG